jgi:hypothetical protein
MAAVAAPAARRTRMNVSVGEFPSEFNTGPLTGNHHRNPLPENV